MKRNFILLVLLTLALLAGCKGRGQKAAEAPEIQQEPDTLLAAQSASKLPQEPIFDIVTNMGTIRVKLYKDTPRHRDNFEKLAMSGYYDSLLFHRVISGFMIQGGDPFTRDTSLVDRYGEGGPSYTIPAEMVDSEGAPLHRHKKGALAAALRSIVANPYKASSGSQFYLVQNPDNCIHLDGEYTVFGETIAGLNVIDKIAATPTDPYDRPLNEVRILNIKPNNELNKEQLERENGTVFAIKNDE